MINTEPTKIIPGPAPSAAAAGWLKRWHGLSPTGDDPATSAEVVRIIIGGQLSAVAPSVGEAAETELCGSVAEQVDAIVTALRKPFDQASGFWARRTGSSAVCRSSRLTRS